MSDKREIRRMVRERISTLPLEERWAMSGAIAEKVADTREYLSARSIFLYYSTSDEPDTRALIDRALAEGKTLYLPRIDGEDMQLVPYRAGDRMAKNRYGIEEPTAEASNEMPDLAVIPLVAFDRDKHRLGRGKGYYDRFLAEYKGENLALAFSVQEVPSVPVRAFDRSPKVIITEKEVIR